MSSCDTRRKLFLCRKKQFLLVSQEEIPLVSQEEISSCVTRRDFFVCHKKIFCLVSQEGISSCGWLVGAQIINWPRGQGLVGRLELETE